MSEPKPFRADVLLRVRYSDTDQMGTFYNSRALDWFECGRTELLRDLRTPYTTLEAAGVFLPVTEAHVEYLGRARYDDLLRVTTSAAMSGKARIRCDVEIEHAGSRAPVARGYTVHAFVSAGGRPMRPPPWFLTALRRASGGAEASGGGGTYGGEGTSGGRGASAEGGGGG